MKETEPKAGDLPVGLSMALARNTRAMTYFSGLSETERQSVIAGTHTLRSRQEMQDYVDRMGQPD